MKQNDNATRSQFKKLTTVKRKASFGLFKLFADSIEHLILLLSQNSHMSFCS
jgi:hypothetical protein